MVRLESEFTNNLVLISVQPPVLNRFRDMRTGYTVACRQIGDGACYF